jgi:hypothetical protein
MLYIRMATADAFVLYVDALAKEIAEQPPRETRKETGFLWWIIKITVGSKEETRFLGMRNRVSLVDNKDNCS